MPATIIDGNAIAAEVRSEWKSRVAELAGLGVIPGLAVVVIGEDPASRIYVGRPIVKPPKPKAIWLLRPNDYTTLASAAKQTIDPARGTAILFGVDCQGVGASGVRFSRSRTSSTRPKRPIDRAAPTDGCRRARSSRRRP